MQSRLSYRRPFASVPLPQFPEISLRFFFFPLPSICCSAVDWPCQSAHYRHLPSPGSAHLISLARPRPLPSFTFLSLLLLILARRDFGLFCGIGANSSSLLPSSFRRRRRRQLCPPPRSSPTWCQRDAEREGSPRPRIDGWMDGSVFWSIGDVFAIPLFLLLSRLCRVAKCLSMMLLLLLGRRRVILVVLQRVRVRGHCRGVEPRL